MLTADPFSFTVRGRPWRTQSWLADVGYGFLEARSGLGFVAPMVLASGAILFSALGLIAFRRVRNVLPSAVFLLASSMLIAPFLNPRPVIFTYALFALVVVADDDPKLRWSLPVLLWVWAAVHGSFVIGGAYLLLQVIRRGRWRLWPELVAGGVAVSMTAHGWAVWQILWDFVRNREALSYISEWRTPNLLSPAFAPLLAGLIGLIIVAMRGRIRGIDFWVLIPFLLLALSSARSVVPSWIALSPLTSAIPEGVRFPGNGRTTARWINAALAATMVLGPLLVPRQGGLAEDRFPTVLAGELTSARVFHDDSTGGYLIYALWPKRQVFIDDRAELYGPLIAGFAGARAGHFEWRGLFREFGVEEALLRVQDPLTETLRWAGWREAGREGDFVLLRSVSRPSAGPRVRDPRGAPHI